METNILETVTTQDFTIKIAEQSDVVEAFYISKVVLKNLLQKNYAHPDLFTDTYQTLKRLTELQSLFILKKNDISLGLLTYDQKEPQEFENILWENKGVQCFYISRIFVLPEWRNKGIGSALIKFAEQLALEKRYNCIRLDTSSTIEEANLLLLKHNYRFAGNVFYHFQKAPVNCYEKSL